MGKRFRNIKEIIDISISLGKILRWLRTPDSWKSTHNCVLFVPLKKVILKRTRQNFIWFWLALVFQFEEVKVNEPDWNSINKIPPCKVNVNLCCWFTLALKHHHHVKIWWNFVSRQFLNGNVWYVYHLVTNKDKMGEMEEEEISIIIFDEF